MCVIIHKPKGVSLDEEALLDCFIANQDMAGFAIRQNNTLFYHKGFSTFEEFHEELSNRDQECEMVLHFRIATHGEVCRENAHPFPLDVPFENKTHGIAKRLLFHNGVVSFENYTLPKNDSDTLGLARDFLAEIRSDKIKKVLERLSNPNKFVFMTPKKTYRFGKFTEQDGCYYSNMYWAYKPVLSKRVTGLPASVTPAEWSTDAYWEDYLNKLYEYNHPEEFLVLANQERPRPAPKYNWLPISEENHEQE